MRPELSNDIQASDDVGLLPEGRKEENCLLVLPTALNTEHVPSLHKAVSGYETKGNHCINTHTFILPHSLFGVKPQDY